MFQMTPSPCPLSCNRTRVLSSQRSLAAIMVSESSYENRIPQTFCNASPISCSLCCGIYQCPICAALNLPLHYEVTLLKFPLTSSKRKLVIEFIVKEVTKRYLGRKFTFCIILKFIDIRKKILVQNLDKGPLQNINFTLRRGSFIWIGRYFPSIASYSGPGPHH